MIGDLCCIETQPENMAAVNTRASVFAVFIFQGFALWNGKADFGVSMGGSFCGFWMVPFRHLPCRDDFDLQ